jgi:hypothetical protein
MLVTPQRSSRPERKLRLNSPPFALQNLYAISLEEKQQFWVAQLRKQAK